MASTARMRLYQLFGMKRLTWRERHVMWRRLESDQPTHETIGGEWAMCKSGKPLSRQRVKQLEGQALAKLGAAVTSVAVLHEADNAARVAELAERGAAVGAQELGFTESEAPALRYRPLAVRFERAYDATVKAFIDSPTRAARERMLAALTRLQEVQ